ncbi:MAG: T9SS type A sorting domain-containing protein, partial [Bacteroidales bacterium]|nr:T9SS type A sorting domain-containing protein [Bacteroidales bacterium]
NSTYLGSVPSTTRHYVIRNRYEAGRAQIVVYNWGHRNDLLVDLSTVLAVGSNFQIWDVMNFSGGPIITGVYNGGAVQVPLNLSSIEKPLRADSNRDVLVHTLPDFGVFVVSSEGNGLSTGINPTITEALPLKIKKCYPNPTVDILAMDVYSPATINLTASVYDEGGRLVHNELLPANIGDNTLVVNLARLAGGIYIVRLTDGAFSDQCKILKRDFALNIEIEPEEEVPFH